MIVGTGGIVAPVVSIRRVERLPDAFMRHIGYPLPPIGFIRFMRIVQDVPKWWAVTGPIDDVVVFGGFKLDDTQIRTFPMNPIAGLQDAHHGIYARIVHPKGVIFLIVDDWSSSGFALPRPIWVNRVKRFVNSDFLWTIEYAMRSNHRFNEEIVYKHLLSWMHFHVVFLLLNCTHRYVVLNPLTGCLELCYDDGVF